jgi:multisubunit Na+/H+ antiporter MnhB subunit
MFASMFALVVLGWSYRRHHVRRALMLLLPGLLLLWLAVLYPPLHHSIWAHAVMMTVGGTLVGLSHWVNLRLNDGHARGQTCASGAC